MFGTVRKHQNWLWAIIIAVIIISFAFFGVFPNMDAMGGRSGGGEFGSIQGKPISQEEFLNAYNEMRLFYRLRFGEWPGNEDVLRMRGFDIEAQSYTRLLLTKKMEEMNLKVPAEATARWISDLFQRGGTPSASVAEQYQQFVKTQLEPNRITAEDFERFARHEVGNQHLASVFGLSGTLVSRSEAETIYKRENELMQTDIVFFSASNFLSQVKASDEDVQRYFDANKPTYRIPNRIQVNYVHLSPTNFMAAAEQQFNADTNANLTVERAYFDRGGTNAFKDAQGNPQTLEQAKPEIKKEYLQRLALMEARKRAAELINKVDEYKTQNPEAKDALAKVAATQGLTVQESPLFDQGTDLKSSNLPFAFKSEAFKLNEIGQFTTSPVMAEEGAFVLSLKQKVEGKIPELAAVKEQVTKDFKLAEATKLARKAGEEFQKAVATGLAEKKSFDSLVTANKAQSVALPAFSLTTQNIPELAGRIPLDRVQNATSRLSPGQSSDFLGTETGGAVIYLRERKPVDTAKMNAEIEEFIQRIKDQRQYAAYETWRSGLAEELQLRRPEAPKPQQEQAQR